MSYLNNAGAFLTQTLLGFFFYLILLRFWMQWTRADFRNPVGQLVISLTNPIVIPLRKVLPSIGYIDTATVILAYAVALLKTYLIVLFIGSQPSWLALASFALSEVIRCSIYIFFAAIFIQIIMSWVNPHSYHPFVRLAHAIAEPILAPARRIIPSIAGIDFSPMAVILFLQLSLILIVEPLKQLG